MNLEAIDFGIVQSFSYDFVDLDFYKVPEGDWHECPFCGQTPKVWSFDNGRETCCGCLLVEFNRYHHFAISAESIMSVYKRTGRTAEYDSDALRKNWNHWVETGEIMFSKPNYHGRW